MGVGRPTVLVPREVRRKETANIHAKELREIRAVLVREIRCHMRLTPNSEHALPSAPVSANQASTCSKRQITLVKRRLDISEK